MQARHRPPKEFLRGSDTSELRQLLPGQFDFSAFQRGCVIRKSCQVTFLNIIFFAAVSVKSQPTPNIARQAKISYTVERDQRGGYIMCLRLVSEHNLSET